MPAILAITAHPDDESFLFGGALAMAAREGRKAGLLCLTDGQAGRDGGICPRERLGEVRREELRRSCELLGIPHLFTPGLMDGTLDRLTDEEGARIVAGFAERFGAEILLSFGPEGASGHADHKACWRFALRAAGERALYVATFPPGLEDAQRGGPGLPITTVVDVKPVEDRKRLAFAAHATQRYHLALHERMMETMKGAEYYHRALPPAPPGAPLETGLEPHGPPRSPGIRPRPSSGAPGSAGRSS